MQFPMLPIPPPQFDGTGNAIPNNDPNTYLTNYSCSVCGGAWQAARQGGGEPIITITQDVKGSR